MYDDVLNFCNENCVVACGLDRVQAAFQIGQRAMQQRSAVLGTVEARSGLGLRAIVCPLRTSVVLGNRPLIFT